MDKINVKETKGEDNEILLMEIDETTISVQPTYKYQAYGLHNFKLIPEVQKYLTKEQIQDIEVVGNILPFKTNSYVINELINWNNVPNDPIFILTFPQKNMLKPEHYEEIDALLKQKADRIKINEVANKIRLQLNPNPGGQKKNIAELADGTPLPGIQHKYDETILFFPSQGQTCHAYCTYCFRWSQFVNMKGMKFATREINSIIQYLQENQEVTDIIFTGGDPLTMSPKLLASYIEPLLDADLPNLQTIRIGSKALTYWPYKFLMDPEAKEILNLFEKVVKSRKHLAIMAHFSHPNELETEAVREAIKRIRSTGAEIRTQSPVLNHINNNPQVWTRMWKEQVRLGMIPYYMFIVRDTGAQDYFAVTLEQSYNIYKKAVTNLSGLARTVRGPSMSCLPGKIEILGIQEVNKKKAFLLRFLQGRNPNWCYKPFFAEYDQNAIWIDDLKPIEGNNFFFEENT